MKHISLFLLCILAGLFSCDNEYVWLDLYPKLNDEEYFPYVAEALEAMNMPRPKGSYNYPFLPGMDTWKELKSGEEMKRVCLIPKKILKKQSTQAVIQAMWEHPDFPMLIGFSSNSSIQQSLDRVLPDWDIYIELTKRPDAASCLVERYYRMNLTKSFYGFYNNSLQLLLSQTVFLDQLPVKEKVLLAKEMAARIEVINQVEGVEAGKDSYCVESSYFCLVRIMTNCGYAPMLAWMKVDEKALNFESEGYMELLIPRSFRDKILELSANFIDTLIV
ncbi:MAG: hypothetical protein J6K31_15035 [Parabacteroides sp.]|nr:hypothetical protein [Parabacteroides sp.]